MSNEKAGLSSLLAVQVHAIAPTDFPDLDDVVLPPVIGHAISDRQAGVGVFLKGREEGDTRAARIVTTAHGSADSHGVAGAHRYRQARQERIELAVKGSGKGFIAAKALAVFGFITRSQRDADGPRGSELDFAKYGIGIGAVFEIAVEDVDLFVLLRAIDQASDETRKAIVRRTDCRRLKAQFRVGRRIPESTLSEFSVYFFAVKYCSPTIAVSL